MSFKSYLYYPVETPFGKAHVLCQGDGFIRLTSNGPRNFSAPLTINSVEYTVSAHMKDYGDGPDLHRQDDARPDSTWNAIYSSRYGQCSNDKITEAARKKFVKWLIPFMREWATAHPYEVALGDQQGATNEFDRADAEYEKANKALQEAFTQLSRAREKLQVHKNVLKTLTPTKEVGEE